VVGLPAKNTLDRATATFPKLWHERLGETGIDFSVVYPSIGLSLVHLRDEELRRAGCRALNMYHADIFAEYTDRLAVAAAIPMRTRAEAIEELEYASRHGLKAVMMAGYAMRSKRVAAFRLRHCQLNRNFSLRWDGPKWNWRPHAPSLSN
jgi:predicted TIM-barrel fold metal-dependent hydrolase